LTNLARAVALSYGSCADIDAQGGGGDGLPDVPPAGSKHARPHGLPRLEETERVMQQVVREGAEPVFEASRGHFRGLAPARHSVEQVPGVDAAEENKEI
jgi:hypothetical protein